MNNIIHNDNNSERITRSMKPQQLRWNESRIIDVDLYLFRRKHIHFVDDSQFIRSNFYHTFDIAPFHLKVIRRINVLLFGDSGTVFEAHLIASSITNRCGVSHGSGGKLVVQIEPFK